MSASQSLPLTSLTDELGLKVRQKIFLTRLQVMHGIVWNGDGAVSTTGAATVELSEYVGPATDVVIGRQALAATRHATVAGRRYDND